MEYLLQKCQTEDGSWAIQAGGNRGSWAINFVNCSIEILTSVLSAILSDLSDFIKKIINYIKEFGETIIALIR